MPDRHAGGLLHAVLRGLRGGKTAQEICEAAMEVLPNPLGTAIVDTEAKREESLLAMATLNEHPQDLLDMLPLGIHEMMAGPWTEQILEGWGKYRGGRPVIDHLQFTTVSKENPDRGVVHMVWHLEQQPRYVLVSALRQGTSPNTAALGMGRIIETAFLVEGG